MVSEADFNKKISNGYTQEGEICVTTDKKI
jgi:hypothetical protein